MATTEQGIPPGSGGSDAEFIPVVDLGLQGPLGARPEPSTRKALARRIDEAFTRSGFMVIVGHGVPQDTVTAMTEATGAFFRQSAEVKAEVAADLKEQVIRGFGSRGNDLVESFTMNRFGEPQAEPSLPSGADALLTTPNQWPSLPGFRAAFLRYYAAMEDLSARLMSLFALALDLEAEWFGSSFASHVTDMTANYYPPQPRVPDAGVGRKRAHTDWGVLTVLHQDSSPGGLEVFHRATGEWVPVPAVPGSFVVNLGDLMARWTNDRWVSTIHRVVNPPRAHSAEDRCSIAFFYQPAPDAVISCLPGCSDSVRAARYPPIRSDEYLTAKRRRAYIQVALETESGRRES